MVLAQRPGRTVADADLCFRLGYSESPARVAIVSKERREHLDVEVNLDLAQHPAGGVTATRVRLLQVHLEDRLSRVGRPLSERHEQRLAGPARTAVVGRQFGDE